MASPPPPPPPQDFKTAEKEVQSSIVATVKTVKSITAEDVAFQRTADPEFGRELDVQMSRLLGLANDLLASAAGVCGVKAPRPLEDAEDINLNWRGIVDVLDSLKEKVDTTLDEYTGLRKKKEGGLGGSTGEPGSSSSSAATAAQQTQKKPRPSQLDRNIRFANVVKPQLAFERRPDNFPQEPWKPLLTSKPHATVPLGQSLVQFKEGASRSQYAPKPHRSYRAFLKSAQAGAKDAVKSTDNERGRQRGKRKRRKRRRTNKRFRFKHPYEAEIVNMTYPEKVSSRADPIMYQPVETTTAKWVDTFEGVLEMLEELKKVDEIAVDLEHHDWRTYFGMVSLMQISTRDKDWIVDTLKPWRHRLEVLNEVFANPAIVKVLHGAHMDVIWLQRDLGLYLVGLFDTFFACDELYPTRSLAYLLKRFVDFDADKKYQMADWRLRPLTDEMYYYARSDTHYLLYIYDMVRRDLHAQTDADKENIDYVERVLQKSKGQALVRYEHLECDATTGEGARGWRNILIKHGNLSAEQFAVFRAVWNWRDDMARREDENPAFLLPQQVVFEIAKILPPDARALHSLVPPQSQIPRKNQSLEALWALIREARAQAAASKGPTSHEFISGSAGRQLHARPAAPRPPPPELEGFDPKTTDRARLFGDLPLSTIYDEDIPVAPGGSSHVPLPWVKFLSEAAEEQAKSAADAAPQAMEIDEPAKVEEEVDEEFTLKRGQKRKADEDNDFIAFDGDVLNTPRAEEILQAHKAQKREQKKSKKHDKGKTAASEAGKEAVVEEEGDEEDEQADEEEVEDARAANKTISRKAAKRARKERNRQKRAAREAEEGAEDQASPETDDAGGGMAEEEGGDAVAEEFISLDLDLDSEAERRRTKREARQQRKQAKAAAKAAAAEGDGGGKEDDEEAFDYATAASVLRAPRGGDDGQGRGGRRVRNFNPYAKADTHAIRGARKAPPVAGARSAVFKK